MKILLLIVMLIVLVPVSQATGAQSAVVAVCLPPYTIAAATASIGVGDINFCVYYPHTVQPGSTFKVSSTLTGPTTVLPVFLSSANSFAAVSGCTEGTPTTFVPSTNGVVGTMWTATTFFTMTAEQCSFDAAVSLTIAAVPLQVYNGGLILLTETENVRVDNLNYLCAATEAAPNNLAPSSTICETPEITIDICPEDSPCFINSNDTVTINGNLSFNQTNLPPLPEPGFDGSLYILVCIMIAVLSYLGQSRSGKGHYAFAAFLSLVAGFVLYWEMDRIGFNTVEKGLTLATIFAFLHLCLAAYLFYLFAKDDEPNTEDKKK